MRALVLAFGAVALSACEHVPLLQLAGSSLGFGEASRFPLTREQVDAVPYASIAVRIGHSAPSFVVLSRYDGESRHWMSANRVVLVTRDGRLVRTAGLPRDIRYMGALPSGLQELAADGAPHKVLVDLTGPDEYDIAMELSYAREGAERITILDHPRDTIRIREDVHVAAWRWSAVNHYWVDAATGVVWKSEQAYCPQIPAVEIEVLKRPT
jgi:hypothetical protein